MEKRLLTEVGAVEKEIKQLEEAVHKILSSAGKKVEEVATCMQSMVKTRSHRTEKKVKTVKTSIKKKRTPKKVGVKKIAKIKSTGQPSIASLIQQILKKANGPVSIQGISDDLLSMQGFETKSKNLPNQLRVLLYQNKQGLFKKAAPGKFVLSAKGKK